MTYTNYQNNKYLSRVLHRLSLTPVCIENSKSSFITATTPASREVKGAKKNGIIASQKKQVEKHKEKDKEKDTYIGGGPNNQTNNILFAKTFTKSLANVLQQKSKTIPTITSTTTNKTINDAATAFIHNLVQSIDDSFTSLKNSNRTAVNSSTKLPVTDLNEAPQSMNAPPVNAPSANAPPANAPSANAPPANAPSSSINNASYTNSNTSVSLNDISPSFDNSKTNLPVNKPLQTNLPVDIANALLVASKMPDSTMPDSTMPDSKMPDSKMPDSKMPDSKMPDSKMPDSKMPDSKIPEAKIATDIANALTIASKMPDSTMPDSTMPDSTMPDSTMPDSTIPDSTMPDSTMPDSTMPDSKIATDIANALMMALKTTNELIIIRAGFINFNADLQLTSMNYFYYDNKKNLQIAQIR